MVKRSCTIVGCTTPANYIEKRDRVTRYKPDLLKMAQLVQDILGLVRRLMQRSENINKLHILG